MEYIVYEPAAFNYILDEFKIDEVKNPFENSNLLVASNTNNLIASNIPDSILNVAIKELWKENGSITIKNGIQLQVRNKLTSNRLKNSINILNSNQNGNRNFYIVSTNPPNNDKFLIIVNTNKTHKTDFFSIAFSELNGLIKSKIKTLIETASIRNGRLHGNSKIGKNYPPVSTNRGIFNTHGTMTAIMRFLGGKMNKTTQHKKRRITRRFIQRK